MCLYIYVYLCVYIFVFVLSVLSVVSVLSILSILSIVFANKQSINHDEPILLEMWDNVFDWSDMLRHD